MKLLLACLTLFFFYNFPNLTNINVLTHNSKRVKNENFIQNPRADSIHIDNTVALMQSAYRKKNWKKANQVAHEVLIKAKELQNVPYLAKAKNYLGNLHLKEAQYDSAYYYFYNAGKDYRVLGDSLRLGKILLNMSIIEKNVNDYYTAINTATKGFIPKAVIKIKPAIPTTAPDLHPRSRVAIIVPIESKYNGTFNIFTIVPIAKLIAMSDGINTNFRVSCDEFVFIISCFEANIFSYICSSVRKSSVEFHLNFSSFFYSFLFLYQFPPLLFLIFLI